MRLRSVTATLFTLALCLALLFQSCSGSFQTTTDPTTDKMAQEHVGDTPVASAASQMEPAIPITAMSVDYATVNGQTVSGYLAQPEEIDHSLPAIIAIHEWWGLNENIEAMARRLAGEGYTVLAVDLYSGQTAEAPDQARQLMQAVMQDPEPAQSNLEQAYTFLTEEYDAPTVGSIGWCFGGGWSLRTGLLLPQQLNALAIYYGQLVTDKAELEPLSMPIIGFFGEDDQAIPVSDVRAFETALNELDKNAEIYIFPGVGHAFANPSGQNYSPEAAEAAWIETTAFFEETLKGAA